MNNGKIAAVVGMCGSGKSVVTEVFKSAGFKSVYFGGVTMEELEKRGLPKTEANERTVREQLRAEHGLAAYAVLLYPRIMQYAEQGGVVLDGLYSWSEYKYLKERLGDALSVLAIVTDRSVRYERLTGREIRPLTNEEAAARDTAEIEKLEKGGPIAIADRYITNNGSTDELVAAVNKYISEI